MGTEAVFCFDLEGMEATVSTITSVVNEINKELEGAHIRLNSAQQAVQSAEEAYNAAVTAYNQQCASIAKSYGEACAAAAKEGRSAPPTPTYPAPPTRDTVIAAEAALAEIENMIVELEEDLAKTQEIAEMLKQTIASVEETEEEICLFITMELEQLQGLSLKYGTKVVTAIEGNSEMANPGFNYVNGKNSNGEKLKLYADLYADLSHEEYITLAQTVGVEATMALMMYNGMAAEQALAVASECGKVYNVEQAQRIFENQVYTDGTTMQEMISDIVESKGDDVVMYVDGQRVGGLYVDPAYYYDQSLNNGEFFDSSTSACAAYAFATALSIKHGTQITPGDVRAYESNGKIWDWAADKAGSVYTGTKGYGSESEVFDAIDTAIDNGDPIVVHCKSYEGEHWATVIGKDVDGDYLVIDPWGGTQCKLSEMQHYTTGSLNEFVTL